MAVDTRQIIALFVFFFGLALCMWRAPKADRWHVVLRLIAVTLWCGLLVFEPRTRTVGLSGLPGIRGKLLDAINLRDV